MGKYKFIGERHSHMVDGTRKNLKKGDVIDLTAKQYQHVKDKFVPTGEEVSVSDAVKIEGSSVIDNQTKETTVDNTASEGTEEPKVDNKGVIDMENIEEVVKEKYHKGGGYYELPNREQPVKKEEAIAAYLELQEENQG
jgi:hypothetical protein